MNIHTIAFLVAVLVFATLVTESDCIGPSFLSKRKLEKKGLKTFSGVVFFSIPNR